MVWISGIHRVCSGKYGLWTYSLASLVLPYSGNSLGGNFNIRVNPIFADEYAGEDISRSLLLPALILLPLSHPLDIWDLPCSWPPCDLFFGYWLIWTCILDSVYKYTQRQTPCIQTAINYGSYTTNICRPFHLIGMMFRQRQLRTVHLPITLYRCHHSSSDKVTRWNLTCIGSKNIATRCMASIWIQKPETGTDMTLRLTIGINSSGNNDNNNKSKGKFDSRPTGKWFQSDSRVLAVYPLARRLKHDFKENPFY